MTCLVQPMASTSVPVRVWVPEAGGWMVVPDCRPLRLEWYPPRKVQATMPEDKVFTPPLVLDLPINRYRCLVCGWEALGTSAPPCPYRAWRNRKNYRR